MSDYTIMIGSSAILIGLGLGLTIGLVMLKRDNAKTERQNRKLERTMNNDGVYQIRR